MPTKSPTWEDTVEDTPPKWEETEDISIATEPAGYEPETPLPPPPPSELRPAGLREQIGLGPFGTGLGIGRGMEREIGRQFGGANIAPQDILDTGFQFASVPPQLRKPIEKVTDVPINLLPPTVAGGVQGLRDVALGTPWAAGVVGLGKQLGTGLLALFAGDFIAQAPEAYQEYKALRAQGRNQEAARLLVSELGTGALLGAGAKIHQDIRAGGKVDPARQALANDILELDAAVPGTLDAAKGMIQRQAPEAQRQAPPPPIAPVAPPKREEVAPAPEPVSPPTAAVQAVAAAGQAPAAAAAPIPEARTLPAQAAAQMSERARAALASASPEYRRALRAEGLTDADMGDLLSGEASVSDVVARRLKPFEGGGGPDHAKALQEARDDAIARIEALGAKFKTPAAPAAELTKAQFGDPLNPSNKFTAQPAKLEPDGGIFYAREHRMGELENRPGQSGFLVVDRDAVDEMAFEHDTYQFTPEDVNKTGMKFVSIPELDAAKGDFYDAIQNQKKGVPDASRIEEAAAVHGDVRPLAEPTGQLPVKEGGEGVQSEAEGGIPKAQPETLPNAPARESVLAEPTAKESLTVEPPSKTAAVEERPGSRGPWLGRFIDDSFSEQQKGYPKAKEVLKGWSDEDLAKERSEMVRASLNPMFGMNAEKQLRLIDAEIAARKPEPAPSKTAVGKGVQKAQAKVAQVARTEGTRSAKEIKAELVKRLEQAVADAPFTTDEYFPGLYVKEARSLNETTHLTDRPVEGTRPLAVWLDLPFTKKDKTPNRDMMMGKKFIAEALERKQVKKVTIEIPDDGVFTVWNTKDALQSVLDRAKRIKTSTTPPKGYVERAGPGPTERKAIVAEAEALAKQPTPPPAAETGEKPTQSVGAAMPSNIGTKAQIEQLADAFRNKAPAKERAWQLVRQSFDFGQRAAAAKDAFSRVLSGINTARKAAQTALTSFEKPDDLLKAKGELSASVETRGWQAREFSKAVKQDTPDIRKRIAMSKWIEADGDPAKLAVGEAATKPEFKQGYRDAQNLTPDEQIKAQNISNYFEARLQEAIDAGVLETGVEDYIHRIYPKDSPFRQRAIAYVQSGILSKNPSLAKKRLFEWDWQAEAAGLRPVQDMLPRIIDYETSLSKAIAARQFIAKLTQMKGPDGRPVIGIKGVGVPVTDPSGVRTATVIKPLGDFKKANNPADPLNYRGDYVNKEYGSLSRWKWVGTDTDGKPIFLQGDVAIHPAFVGRVQALLEPSHVRYGRYPRLGTGLLTVGSTVKQTMLDLSGFHQVQIAVHGLEHRVNPFHLVQDIDFADPKMQGLLKGGLTLGGEFHESHMGEGLVGRSLTQHVPVLGPLLETYHNWLFQDFIPRVKTTMALHALERNRSRYAKDLASGKMTEADLNYLTAKQANAAFGELNYITMERSKTTQDLARLIMLAPDFLEARAKFVGQALTKYGTEQRMALLFGALAMYSAARVLNKIIDDQYHLEPENLFNVVKGNTRYSLRTVQGDVLHAITRPLSFWLNRLNPVYSRTLLELISQRDQFGRKRDLRQILGDTVSTVRPIALRSSREQSLLQSIWNAFGVTARRYDDVQEARKLADDWKKKNKVREAPGEFIYDSDKDPLRPLKLALSDNDDGGAVAEIRKVLQGKVMTLPKMDDYFRRYAKANFTGSAFNERKWMQSLSADDRKTVQAAQQHRQAMLRLYYQARQQYFTALNASK